MNNDCEFDMGVVTGQFYWRAVREANREVNMRRSVVEAQPVEATVVQFPSNVIQFRKKAA